MIGRRVAVGAAALAAAGALAVPLTLSSGGGVDVLVGSTPTPTVGAGCPVATAGALDGPDPWGGCWPGPQTTGVTDEGALATVTSGDFACGTTSFCVVLNTDGMTYEDKFVNGGCILVTADNVTIRNVRIVMPSGSGECTTGICNLDVSCSSNDGGSNTSLLVEDVEVNCGTGDTPGRSAILDRDYTVRRAYLHGNCENTLGMSGPANNDVRDSFIDEQMDYVEATDPHTDGFQVSASSNVTIQHNAVYGNFVHGNDPGTPGVDEGDFGNAAINTGAPSGYTNITVHRNLVAGGGYTVYCPNYDADGQFVLTENHFSDHFTNTADGGFNAWTVVGGFGPSTNCADEAGVSGNVYHESGLPITLG